MAVTELCQTPTVKIRHGSKDTHLTASKEKKFALANTYTQVELTNLQVSAEWRCLKYLFLSVRAGTFCLLPSFYEDQPF